MVAHSLKYTKEAQMDRYTIAALVSGALVGFAGPTSRLLILEGMSSEEISMMRFGLATLSFFLISLYKNPKYFKVKLQHIWLFLCCGVLGQFGFALFYFRAINLAPLAVVSTLSSTYPFFVLLISWRIWREKFTFKKISALILAVLGGAFVTGATKENAIPLQGAMLALASGISYALFCVFSRTAFQKGYSPKTVNFYSWLFAFLSSLIAWPEQHPFTRMFVSWQNIIICLILGVVIACGGNYLFSYSLTGIAAGRASILASSSPLFATLGGVILFQETVSFQQFFGIFFLVSAIFLLNSKDIFALFHFRNTRKNQK